MPLEYSRATRLARPTSQTWCAKADLPQQSEPYRLPSRPPRKERSTMFDNIRRLLVRAHAINNHQSVLDNAIGITMINQVPGDYLEFGVFRGDRLTQAYETAVF